jgi:hypothetical protein
MQRLAQENAQLREHCQRLEAEQRVLKVRRTAAVFGLCSVVCQNHLVQMQGRRMTSAPAAMQPQQDPAMQAYLAQVIQAQQMQAQQLQAQQIRQARADGTRRRSMTSPSSAFHGQPSHPHFGRMSMPGTPFVRGPFASPETPSLSEDASEYDDDDDELPFQPRMGHGHSMPTMHGFPQGFHR